MSNKLFIQIKIELSFEPFLYCSLCGQPIMDNQKMSLDHHIPRCHGGPDVAANLMPAHTICNSIKNDLMPDEFETRKLELYQTALKKWHLKRKDKLIVEKALKKNEIRQHQLTKQLCVLQ